MQKGYWISCYREIYDADKLADYAELAKPAVEVRVDVFSFAALLSTWLVQA